MALKEDPTNSSSSRPSGSTWPDRWPAWWPAAWPWPDPGPDVKEAETWIRNRISGTARHRLSPGVRGHGPVRRPHLGPDQTVSGKRIKEGAVASATAPLSAVSGRWESILQIDFERKKTDRRERRPGAPATVFSIRLYKGGGIHAQHGWWVSSQGLPFHSETFAGANGILRREADLRGGATGLRPSYNKVVPDIPFKMNYGTIRMELWIGCAPYRLTVFVESDHRLHSIC